MKEVHGARPASFPLPLLVSSHRGKAARRKGSLTCPKIMDVKSATADEFGAVDPAGLAALARISFPSLDPVQILAAATDGAETLCPCRIEASYCAADDKMKLCPPTQAERPELTDILERSSWEGKVQLAHDDWARALPLRHRNVIHGCLVLGGAVEPTPNHLLLLDVLAQRAGAALACANLHQRDIRRTRQLEQSNEGLTSRLQRLEARTHAHDLLDAAVTARTGQDGIVDALHRLTGCSVCVEDRFGNLRAWSGPGQPISYPKATAGKRDQFLRLLSAQGGPLRVENRVCVLIQPHAEILGVVALINGDKNFDEEQSFALQYGSSLLGVELAHQRSLAEMALTLRRELVDDLLAGTDADGAYARAEAMGYDLRRPQYVMAIHSGRGAAKADIAAVSRAAANLHLNHLMGQHGRVIVVVADGHPAVEALHREVSRQLGHEANAIGIGSRCDAPADFPQSFLMARRAMKIRLHSAHPHGASDYGELGFYHLVDAAHSAGVAEDYVRQWLGALIDYDAAKNSDLVHTLGHFLEYGGNYDESAAALHIHRSTLRYRLGRIADLTGFDLRNVDTRFNLHAATRGWRFLTPDS
ncbi:MAG: helix-turn-helix domain-containing protein [Mycobacterium sp.]